MLKFLLWALSLSAATILLLVILFAGYGLFHGYDVISALHHLLSPRAGPVETNLTIHPMIEDVPWSQVTWLGDIENYALNEASGLAISRRHDDVLFSMNDSGGETEIFALTTSGKNLGTWQVDVDTAVDWEALESFVWQGKPYLLIADVGDNFRWRPMLTLHVVAEPELTNASVLTPEWSIRYEYPDGYRDCEAVAVDIDHERVLLLSKRHYPSEVFALPLRPEATVKAKKLNTLVGLPRPTQADYNAQGLFAAYLHMPSGMSIQGEQAIVTTYQHAYLFDLAFKQKQRLPLPSIGQREAIVFARHTNEAYITKERPYGVGISDIYKIKW